MPQSPSSASSTQAAGPLPRLMLPLTIPASWLYRLAVAARHGWHAGGRGERRVPLPVISIGNLSAGGTGKTPMTVWVCQQLLAQARHPMIAMRGYGAPAGDVADEQAELMERLPSVPIVAGADRRAAVMDVLPPRGSMEGVSPSQGTQGWPEIECVVLDDGFQHRRLARDLDIVLIDATRGTLDDRLLPAGWLREPPSALGRADAVVVTRAEGVEDSLARQVRRYHGRDPAAWTRHLWTGIGIVDRSEVVETAAWLAGRRVVTVLGVGHPASIRRQVDQAGGVILHDIPVADHQRYDAALVARIRARCDAAEALLTTAKDWVKLRHLIDPTQWPCPIAVPQLGIGFLHGEEALRGLITTAVQGHARR